LLDFLLQFNEVLFAFFPDLFFFEDIAALILYIFHFRFKRLFRTGQVASDILLDSLIEEIVTLFLQLDTFFDAHIGPGIFNVGNSSVVDAGQIRIQDGNIHRTIQRLSLQ
jgi:hypothetical protein